MKQTKLFLQIGAVLAALTMPTSAAVLSVSPVSQTINVGDTALVNIDVSGLGNGAAPALAAFTGILIGYDGGLLTPTTVTFSNRLGDSGNPIETLLLSNLFFPGAVQLDGASFLTAAELYALQTSPGGTFTLATIAFQGIAAGLSNVTLTFGSLSDENGLDIMTSTTGGLITVNGTSAVPEPSTWMLLTSAGAVLAMMRRRM
jgi:hypothetical protein